MSNELSQWQTAGEWRVQRALSILPTYSSWLWFKRKYCQELVNAKALVRGKGRRKDLVHMDRMDGLVAALYLGVVTPHCPDQAETASAMNRRVQDAPTGNTTGGGQ